MFQALLRFDLVRDSDDRPIAIRIRIPEIGLSGRIRPILSILRDSIPRFELGRDATGRPITVRIRLPSLHVRQRVRAIAGTIRQRVPPVPWRLVWAYQVARARVLYAIPELELRRDGLGQPDAIVCRFGGRIADVPGLGLDIPHRGPKTIVVPISEWLNEPRRPGLVATAVEVWHYRRFINFLGAKSFRKLYARTILGWTWAFVTPIFPILLNVFVFGALIGVTSEGIPYFLFLMIGNLAWDFFASALMWSTRGLEMHRGVIDRVYVPRVILPIATMTPALFNFLINFVATILVVLYYWMKDRTPYLSLGVNTLWSVVALAMIMTLVAGISLFTSVWGEKTRDARFVLGSVTSMWFLATPVLYPTSQVPLEYQKWLALNPLASFVEAFKYGCFRTNPPDPMRFAIGAAMSMTVLLAGLLFFARHSEIEEAVIN